MSEISVIENAGPKLSPQDAIYVNLVARHYRPVDAARMAYGLKGEDADIQKFVEAKREQSGFYEALRNERLYLKELGCATRAERRWKLAHYIRESCDPDVVLKAIQLDNRMTGEEAVRVGVAEGVSVYVARAGDVIEVEDDCV